MPRKLNVPVERRINLDQKKLEGLPEELLKQLRFSVVKKPTKISVMLEILKDHKEPMNVDDLLIAYYRKTGVVLKRIGVSSSFGDVVHKGIVLKVGGLEGTWVYNFGDKDAR